MTMTDSQKELVIMIAQTIHKDAMNAINQVNYLAWGR